jgi:hypothetical protein
MEIFEMLSGMTEFERNAFLERISATVIANQAFLKCSISGSQITTENVISYVGDFIDPTNPHLQEVIEKIGNAIDEVFAAAPQQLDVTG